MHLSRLASRSFVLAILLALAVTTPAGAATSVAYVDEGSVWLSSLDGLQKVKIADPVTVSDETGSWQEPWIDVTQSDGGRIVAVRNKPGRISNFSWFQVWEPDGTSTVQGPLNAPGGFPIYVYPLGFDITSDGKHLVYGYSNAGLCCPITFAQGTYVRPATNSVLAPIDRSGQQHPSLFGSRMIAHSGSSVNVQPADLGNPYTTTFTPWLNTSGTGLEQDRTDIAATGTLIAAELKNTSVTPEIGKIALISVQGVDVAPAFPAAVDCFLPANGVAKEASLSQDATRIAWTDADGLKVAGAPTTAADPCVLSSPAVVISATGRHAAIGGADVAAFMPKPPPTQDPAPQNPTPTNPTPQNPAPTAPVAPTVLQVKVAATATKFAAIRRTGTLPVTFPVRQANVRANVVVRVSARQAKALGLRVPARATTLVIGTGVVTSTRAGQVVKVTTRFTRAFRTAFAQTVATKPAVRAVVGTLAITLTRDGLVSRVNKPLRLTR